MSKEVGQLRGVHHRINLEGVEIILSKLFWKGTLKNSWKSLPKIAQKYIENILCNFLYNKNKNITFEYV